MRNIIVIATILVVVYKLDRLRKRHAVFYLAQQYINYILKTSTDIREKYTSAPLHAPVELSDLNKIRSTQGDVTNARKVLHNTNRVSLAFYKCNLADLLIKKIEELFGGKVTLRGIFMYPSNGYCGWHTNSNVIGKRIYLVWAKTSNQSFFRYWDDRESRIVTKYDKKVRNAENC